MGEMRAIEDRLKTMPPAGGVIQYVKKGASDDG